MDDLTRKIVVSNIEIENIKCAKLVKHKFLPYNLVTLIF